MSNLRFIELSSSFRNRTQYPKQAQFTISFNSTSQNREITQERGTYLSPTGITTKISYKRQCSTDVVTTGVVDYLWGYIYDTGAFNSGGSLTTANLESNNTSPTALYITTPNYYVGYTVVIFDLTGNFLGLSLITTSTYLYLNYTQITYNSFTTPGTIVNYTTAIDGGTIGTGSTTSSIVVIRLNNVYNGVYNYYVGYKLNIYTIGSSSVSTSIITSYNPSLSMFTINTALSVAPTSGMYFTITDPSTGSSIVIPGIDKCGKAITDADQWYKKYYVINETLSYGSSVVYSKVSSYNFLSRTLTLETPFSTTNNTYSLRKTLPSEVITTVSPPVLSGSVTAQINPTTLTITGLTSTANYVGFQLVLPGYPTTTITSTSASNTQLVVATPLTLASFPLAATLNMTLPGNSISLSTNCIFLPPTANQTDNYYTGNYIYVYPSLVADNQTTPMSNIQGSCFYITSYIGNGYNTCFVTGVNAEEYPTKRFYPSYSNTITTQPLPGTLINIVQFMSDNSVSLNYNGSIVSQMEPVAYEIGLVNLTLPNQTLVTGSNIAYYPYVYVEFSAVNQSSSQALYSNNPKSKKALFIVPITDIKNPDTATFIKLNSGSMVQTVKFKPNDTFQFSVYLPDGRLFETVMTDWYSPSAPNPLLQIDALFGFVRLAGL